MIVRSSSNYLRGKDLAGGAGMAVVEPRVGETLTAGVEGAWLPGCDGWRGESRGGTLVPAGRNFRLVKHGSGWNAAVWEIDD